MAPSGFYKVSLQLEIQKFKNSNKGLEKGFKLNESQLRALNALSKLLAQAIVNDTAKWDPTNLEDWQYLTSTPVVSISRSKYLEAYFCCEQGSGKRRGHQAQIALNALSHLAKTNMRILCKREQKIIKWKGIIIKNLNGNKEAFFSGKKAAEFAFHPIFAEGIFNGFHVLKPNDLYGQVSNCLKKKNGIKHAVLFIEYLQTLDCSLPTSKETLLTRLWLDGLNAARKRSEVMKKIDECFKAAYELKFLVKTIINPKNQYEFILNPELCKRWKGKKKTF